MRRTSSAPSGSTIPDHSAGTPQPGDLVVIHYRRPPDRIQTFRQRIVARDGGVVVTLVERTPMPGPSLVDGKVILEDQSPALWFSFEGAAHDVGRFHRADGSFTGVYGNVLTPVEGLDGPEWRTTDLFLDVWLPAEGGVMLLDEEELRDALARGWIDAATAASARAEADRLIEEARAGTWPPAIVGEWTLERARATLRHLPRTDV